MRTYDLRLILLPIIICNSLAGFGQSFTSVFHEYGNFPNVDEVIHGDFNGDGNVDYVITGNFVGQIKVGIGNGIAKPSFKDVENSLSVFSLEAIDFDSDGDLDFIGSVPSEDASYVWLNDGAANFTRDNLSIPDYESIHFADLNDDGILNAIVGADDKIDIYDLSSSGLSLNKNIFSDIFAGNVGSIIAFDYDMDDDMDIVAALSSDGIFLFRQGDNFSFSEENLFGDTYNNDDLHSADFNEDGIIDFVVQSDFEGKSSLILSDPASGYFVKSIPRKYGANLFTTVADLEDSGVTKIVHADGDMAVEGGLFTIFTFDKMTGSLPKTIIEEEHVDTEDGGVVDIDGDGLLDIYIYTNDFFDTGLVFYLQEATVDNDGDGYNSDVDCDDTNPDVNPGATEVTYNGLDDDCDPETLDDDLDQDGFVLADDCDDTNPDINPNAMEIANNGIDEDCDGMDLISSIHELAGAIVNIYPNPAVEFIHIKVDGRLDIEVNIFSSQGELIMTNSNINKLNLDSFVAGIYFLEIKDLKTSQRLVERILVEK